MAEGQINDAAYAGRPSLCRNCGALVGAGEAVCAVCGAPVAGVRARSVEQSPSPIQDAHTRRFVRAVFSRPATFTFIFLFANVIIFLLTSLSGALEDSRVLIAYGAKVNSLIDDYDEWWRFVTPIFLHGNIPHILMNMYGLFVLGPYVEKLYGSAKFVVFWVVAGVAGVVASYLSVQPALANSGLLGRFLFKSGDAISVGASGALFGLIGVLFVFGIKFRRELPDGFKQAFGAGMLPTILLNIFIGFAIPVIDNAAHLGGLVAGAALALFVGYKRPHEKASVAVLWHILQIAALALVVVSFIKVALNFDGPRPTLRRATRTLSLADRPAAVKHLEAVQQGLEAFADAFNGDASKVEAAVKRLDDAPQVDDETAAIGNDLKMLLMRSRDLAAVQPKDRAAQREHEQARRELLKDLQSWQQRHEEWIKTEGPKYGIVLKEPNRESGN